MINSQKLYRCFDFIFKNYQIMRCNKTYMMKMLKPCANVFDFVEYTTSNLRLHTISGAKLYTTRQVWCCIVKFESGQIPTRQP